MGALKKKIWFQKKNLHPARLVLDSWGIEYEAVLAIDSGCSKDISLFFLGEVLPTKSN